MHPRSAQPPPSDSPHIFTPPWLKRRHNPPTQASPSPQDFYALPSLPPLETISVPRQAKSLTVAPPPEDPVRDHRPRPKDNKPKARPGNITVVPASHPIALVTARTPLSLPPPISAVFQAPGHSRGSGSGGDRSAPRTPSSPQPNPYIDPALGTGLPRTLGLKAFPVRADRPWRNGG